MHSRRASASFFDFGSARARDECRTFAVFCEGWVFLNLLAQAGHLYTMANRAPVVFAALHWPERRDSEAISLSDS